jgi:DNA-binding CsgD family transcriptional regulator
MQDAFRIVFNHVRYDRLSWRAGVFSDTGLTSNTIGMIGGTISSQGSHNALRFGGCDFYRNGDFNLLPPVTSGMSGIQAKEEGCDRSSHSIGSWYRFSGHDDLLTRAAHERFTHLSFLYLSLHRDDPLQSFSQEEREVAQSLHTHICEAWSTSVWSQLQRCQQDLGGQDNAGAVVTLNGTILFSDVRFMKGLANEWSTPSDGRLPAPLRIALMAGKDNIVGDAHSYGMKRDGAIAYVCARRRRAVDSLTVRELQVAQHIASGLTHKEIAKVLGVSPNTVRKQIVSIHERMGVRNNAELATHLGLSLPRKSESLVEQVASSKEKNDNKRGKASSVHARLHAESGAPGQGRAKHDGSGGICRGRTDAVQLDGD